MLNGLGAAYAFRLDDSGTPGDPADDFWPASANLPKITQNISSNFSPSLAYFGHAAAVSADGAVALVGAPQANGVELYGGAVLRFSQTK